jgi:hypothetical protein
LRGREGMTVEFLPNSCLELTLVAVDNEAPHCLGVRAALCRYARKECHWHHEYIWERSVDEGELAMNGISTAGRDNTAATEKPVPSRE